MIFKALIVEDEIPARITLRSYLKRYFTQIEVEAEVDTVRGAVSFLENNPVDFIFLDVQLKDGKGVDIFNFISPDGYKIIFTTAFDQHTKDAFRLKSFGYLLKPLSPSNFKEIVNRALKDLIVINPESKKVKVPVKRGERWIDTQDIIRCESASNYTKIYCCKESKPFTVSKTLKFVEQEMIGSDDFIRVHQSHLINSHFINDTEIVENSISLTTGETIPISRSRKADLIDLLKRMKS